jgi:hypothetical protein
MCFVLNRLQRHRVSVRILGSWIELPMCSFRHRTADQRDFSRRSQITDRIRSALLPSHRAGWGLLPLY